jgi:hypothetical protein
MKYLLIYLGANLPSLACVVCACHLALHGCDGWGWFLLVGLAITASVRIKEKPQG